MNPADESAPANTPASARRAERHDRSTRGLFRLERGPIADGPADGDLVLLVHGAMDRSGSFRRVMRRLPDWSVVTYDRRGYGDSRELPPSSDFADQVDDLFDVLDGRRAVAVGHSYGGAVVAAAAMARPDLLDSVVIFEPPAPWRDFWPQAGPGGRLDRSSKDPEDRAEEFMRTMIGDEVWARLPAATRERRREEGPALVAELRALRDGPVYDPKEITVPVIAAAGDTGAEYRRRSAEVLAEEAPLGRFVEVANCGHGVHLSHPAELASLVVQASSRRGDASMVG